MLALGECREQLSLAVLLKLTALCRPTAAAGAKDEALEGLVREGDAERRTWYRQAAWGRLSTASPLVSAVPFPAALLQVLGATA